MKYLVDFPPSSLHLILAQMAMARSSILSLFVTASMVAVFRLLDLWSLFSLFVRFRMLSVLLALLFLPAFLQYAFMSSLMSSHCWAFVIGGCIMMISSMTSVCFLDLRSVALKRHVLDLLEFLLESDRRIALWSESAPM